MNALSGKAAANSARAEAINQWIDGASVIPLAQGKPAIKWTKYKSRQPTLSELCGWFDEGCSEFGVITGSVSNRFVIEISAKALERYNSATFPNTQIVNTGGGIQIHHRHPGRKVLNKIASPGVRILGDCAIALLPDAIERGWRHGYSPSDFPMIPASPQIIESVIDSKIHTCPVFDADISSIKTEMLIKWSRQPRFSEAAIEQLEIPTRKIGDRFRCVLPTGRAFAPEASLVLMPSGHTFYRSWNERAGLRWFSLQEIYASQSYGHAVNLAAPERAVWLLRMLIETGQVQSVHVPHKNLWSGASRLITKIYDGLILGLSCRWLYTNGAPMPLAARFGSAWCGVNKSSVGPALGELVKRKWIRVVDTWPGSYGKRTNLYLPELGE